MALKIIFSLRESKISLNMKNTFNGLDLIFPKLLDQRFYILTKYDNLLKPAHLHDITKVFGV